jgi:hypothetical protein
MLTGAKSTGPGLNVQGLARIIEDVDGLTRGERCSSGHEESEVDVKHNWRSGGCGDIDGRVWT